MLIGIAHKLLASLPLLPARSPCGVESDKAVLASLVLLLYALGAGKCEVPASASLPCRALMENRSKVLVSHASSAYKHSLQVSITGSAAQ
jgi:hypothetical protein